MSHEIFGQLSLVIVLVAAVSIIMRLLRQPLILGYIVAGILAGPSMLNLIHSSEVFEGFSSIGIALLLFIIGLGMNIAVIRRVGKSIFITAGAVLLTVGSIGMWAALLLLDISWQQASIIGLALFFSSTIIIVKVLTDKKEQNRLHGQIAIGVIILDDIVATLALLFVAAGDDNNLGMSEVGLLVGKGIGLLSLLVLASKYVLPRVARYIAASQEGLFLFAIAWGFGIASLFEYGGFSIEVGSLFAGISLASLPYAQEIESRLKPLRDFFVVLFFITLGESLEIHNLSHVLLPAAVLSLVVILLKPAVVTSTLGLLGYPKRVAFKAGINLSQISEFSIVFIVLAATNGLIGKDISAIMTIVAMTTITTSTYLMHYDNKLFTYFDRLKIFWPLFARVKRRESETYTKSNYQIVLFGYHRGGREFIRTFQTTNKPFIVVDYDPSAIDALEQQHIPCLYGDATDIELLEEIGIEHAQLIITTMADFETNQELLKHINLYNDKALVICNANSDEEAMQLYELGCSYVMIPHQASSEQLNQLLQGKGLERHHFDTYRTKHLQQLEKRHPVLDAEEAA